MKTDPTKSLLHEQFAMVWNNDNRMTDFCVKKTAATAILQTGEILTVERQNIEKRFCFGESGYDYDDAMKSAIHARNSADYFRRENNRHFADLLQSIDDAAETYGNHKLIIYTGGAYIGQPAECRLRNWGFARMCDVIDACGGECHICDLPGKELTIRFQPCRIATPAEIELIRAAVQTAATAHAKRVETYLKKYGLTQVRTWTYWRDA